MPPINKLMWLNYDFYGGVIMNIFKAITKGVQMGLFVINIEKDYYDNNFVDKIHIIWRFVKDCYYM